MKMEGVIMKIVGVTACTIGLAHTYMAATALKDAAKKKGYSIKIETQGSLGVKDKLDERDISEADVVILACDTKIKDSERFKDKKCLEVKVSSAVKEPGNVIDKALELINE